MKLKFRAWHKSKEIMSEVNRIDFWSEEIETVIHRDASFVLSQKVGENVKTMSFGTQFSRSDLLEVIGNIYETPEELE